MKFETKKEKRVVKWLLEPDHQTWLDSGDFKKLYISLDYQTFLKRGVLTDVLLQVVDKNIILQLIGDIGKIFEESGTEEVNIPEGVTCVKPYTFSGSNLKTVTFPEGLREIGESAFQGTLIDKIVLPEGFTTIQDEAFCDCAYLYDVVMPKSVTHIGQSAFEHGVYDLTIHYNGTSKEFENIELEDNWCRLRRVVVKCTDEDLEYVSDDEEEDW